MKAGGKDSSQKRKRLMAAVGEDSTQLDESDFGQLEERGSAQLSESY